MLRPMADDATANLLEAEARAARWLRAWDGQGLHRTATAGDQAGADWLATEAAALGGEVSVEEFALDRLDPVHAFLEIADVRIPAVPAFDAPPTEASGIEGRLGAEIAAAVLSPRDVYSGRYRELRGSGGHRAFVILCAGEEPGIALLNAEQFREPYGAPAIHVASEASEAVLAATAGHAPARVVSHSSRTPARGRNIAVALPAPAIASGRAPLVVMTPRSSWWQSTAERGGGIVCWLEALRALIAEPPKQPVVFTANSGHELGHLGLDDFVARRPGIEEGATWVHFGANIGAAGGQLSLMSASAELRALATAELPEAALIPATLVPSGETRDIHKKGGRYLTLVGTNRWFHLPQDRWPRSVDVGAIARIAAVGAGIVRSLAR